MDDGVDPTGSLNLLHAHTLGDLLREHRRSHPDKTALVCAGDRYSYREFDERVNRLAASLSAGGFSTGDRLLWLGQNCHRMLEGLLAAAKLGGTFCPANWRQSSEELAFLLSDFRPAVVLWQEEEIGERVRELRDRDPQVRWIRHDGDGKDDYEARLASAAEHDLERFVDPGAPLLQLYTAAFEGRPAGAQLSHEALLLQGIVVSKLQDVDESYVYLNCGPLFHIATLMTTLATLVWAGTNVFTRRVDPEELCRLIEAEGCQGAFVMGPTLQQMAEVNADARYDLRSLRSFRATPAWNAMTSEDTSPWGRRPGGYGQTEATGLLTLSALGAGATGSHGRPGPLVQLRIVDPEGREVPNGETGEIVARGPTLMLGYWERAERNLKRQRGGWHHSGDLGRRESDGSISFIGPRTRIIKSAAENIYPAEVEACLRRHPAIADCAVIGVPDPKWSQSVLAVLVARKDQSASAEEIETHCRAHMASYKKPRRIEWLDALPRKGFGVDYDALDTRFGGGGYPGSQP